MSYLSVPRLHFSGNFQADPSTVNNNDLNWDPNTELSNDRNAPGWVYWNPNGTHNWKLANCTVRGAANDQGQFTDSAKDPVIGAQVISSGRYPAKLVDLDPDNQSVSQIWGLQVQVSIPDPQAPGKVLASVTGTMPPTAFADLWNRANNIFSPGMGTMSAAFQAVLQNVTWVNASASPLLAALQKISPSSLSIRFIVDSFQPDSNQANFTFGRVAGTIGPALPGEAPRSAPRRMAQQAFWDMSNPKPPSPPPTGGAPSIFSLYGGAPCLWDAARNVLVLDLGNCVPTTKTPPSGGFTIPQSGWPIADTTFQLTIPGPSVSPGPRHMALKSGRSIEDILGGGAPAVIGTIPFSLDTYLNFAGVVEVPVPSALAPLLIKQPLTLTDITNPAKPVLAVQEDELGRYVDVDVPFFRLNPGDKGQVTLWATLFGNPWNQAELPVALTPPGPAANNTATEQVPWQNGSPEGALILSDPTKPPGNGGSAITLTTGTNGPPGTATLTLTAGDPGTPRMYSDGQPGPDGQVYLITGPWAAWGQLFLFSGAPVNVVVFSSYVMPAQPNWDQHVGPILSTYARMHPYMKGILDLSDYATVVENADDIHYVMNLPQEDPHYMPIVRDLSGDKLAMINKWFATGTPKSPGPGPAALA